MKMMEDKTRTLNNWISNGITIETKIKKLYDSWSKIEYSIRHRIRDRNVYLSRKYSLLIFFRHNNYINGIISIPLIHL